MLVLTSLFLASLAVAAPLLPRQTCYKGVYIIAARGSTEATGEGSTAQVVQMIESRVPNSGDVAVNYPATLSNYPSSVTAGINDAKKKIQDYVAACGASSRIVLVGYSQGGEVMTDTLAGGVDKPAPLDSSFRKYITAVVVFGDPSFTAGQSFDRGTSTKDGIFRRAENGASLALLNSYAGVVRSYCDEHDQFCASGDSLAVHLKEVSAHAAEAVEFVVGKV